MSKEVPKMIAVDFDGTLCSFEYPGIGAPKPGAKEALTRLRELGYHVLIYSCRTSSWFLDIFISPDEVGVPTEGRRVVVAMKAYLDKHEIPYDSIDMGDLGKPLCDAYIDDKGVRFDNNWPQVIRFVENGFKGV